jgi:hypothetical protein
MGLLVQILRLSGPTHHGPPVTSLRVHLMWYPLYQTSSGGCNLPVVVAQIAQNVNPHHKKGKGKKPYNPPFKKEASKDEPSSSKKGP